MLGARGATWGPPPTTRGRTHAPRFFVRRFAAQNGPGRDPFVERPWLGSRALGRPLTRQLTRQVACPADRGGGWGLGRILENVGTIFRFGGSEGQAETVQALDDALASHVEVAAVRGVIQRRLEDEVVQELTSFSLDKLSSGRCPSQAVFVRIPCLPTAASIGAPPAGPASWQPPELFSWPVGSVVVAVRGILMLANGAATSGVECCQPRITALVGSGARRDGVSIVVPGDSGLEGSLGKLWPASPFRVCSYDTSDDPSLPSGAGTCTVVVTLAASPPAFTTLHASVLPVLARLQAAKSPFLLAVVYMDDSSAEAAPGGEALTQQQASYIRRRTRGQTRALVEGNTRLLLERLARLEAQLEPPARGGGDSLSDSAGDERRATSAAASGSSRGSADGGSADGRQGKRKASAGVGGGALDMFRTAVGALGAGAAKGDGPPALLEAIRAAVLAPRVNIQDLRGIISQANQALVELSKSSEVGDAPLALAIRQAEGRLAAAEVESVLEAALDGSDSKTTAALPKLEAASAAAAGLAKQGPLISEMVASRLNRLCARVDGRAAALRQTAAASAALLAAMPPAGEPMGSPKPGQVDALDAAISNARLSPWPWQLATPMAKAQEALELWRGLAEIQAAADARSIAQLSLAVRKVASRWPEADLSAARRALSLLEASAALERGDTRLKAYFAAVKTVWGGGVVSAEGAAILAELRETLRITPAEHEQVLIVSGAMSAASAAAAPAPAADSPAAVPAAAVPAAEADLAAPAAAAAAPAPAAIAAAASGDIPVTGGFVGVTAQELAAATAPLKEAAAAAAATAAAEAAANAASDPSLDDPASTSQEASPEAAEAASAAAQQALQLSESGGCWRKVGPNLSYDEEQVLGVGSRGTYVFRGWVSVTSRQRHPVAVKRVVRPPGLAGRLLVELVEREVELLTALNQSPLVPFFHTWALNDVHVFIAYELCPESLAEFIVRQPELPLEERLRIFREAAAALAWLHDPRKAQGAIAHNDIKPENLLISTAGSVKLADIGLGVRLAAAAAGGAGGEAEGDGAYSLSTFRSYGVDINLHGRAPEVLQQKRLTPAADVWALGLVAFFVLTGRPSPFVQDGAAPLPAAVTDERILQGRFDLSALMTLTGQPRTALEARLLVAAMLSPEPSERPTAAQVAQHPVFWSPSRALEAAKELHAAGGDPDGVLLRLSAARGGGARSSIASAERAALLAASLYDLQDWPSRVDPTLRDRIFSYAAPSEAYSDTFDSLLRFCRNVWEHPPAAGEIPALMRSLYEATGVPPRRPRAAPARRELAASYLLALFPGLAIAVHAVAPEIASVAAAAVGAGKAAAAAGGGGGDGDGDGVVWGGAVNKPPPLRQLPTQKPPQAQQQRRAAPAQGSGLESSRAQGPAGSGSGARGRGKRGAVGLGLPPQRQQQQQQQQSKDEGGGAAPAPPTPSKEMARPASARSSTDDPASGSAPGSAALAGRPGLKSAKADQQPGGGAAAPAGPSSPGRTWTRAVAPSGAGGARGQAAPRVARASTTVSAAAGGGGGSEGGPSASSGPTP